MNEDVDRNRAAENRTDPERDADASAVVLDWQAARERIPGGEEGVRELTAMMLEECPRLLEAIKQGVAAGDTSRVRLDAHTLGGSARHFAARSVSGAAFEIEALARQGDLSAIRGAVPDLERKVDALLLALADGPAGDGRESPLSGDSPGPRVGKEDSDRGSGGEQAPEEAV